MRRWRAPKAKFGELKAVWGKLPYEDPQVCYAWGDGCKSADGHLLHSMLSAFPPGSCDHNYLKELEIRGYDLTTLKFSVQKKKVPSAQLMTNGPLKGPLKGLNSHLPVAQRKKETT